MPTIYPGSGNLLCDPFRDADLDETAVEVTDRPTELYGWFLHNAGASTIYVHFYDALVADVVVGTTTPILSFGMPSGASANVLGNYAVPFQVALTVAATTSVDGTGAPGANEMVVNLLFQ